MYSSFNLAILESLGKSPEEMEVLHISAIVFVRMFAPYFKTFCETSSISAAFEVPKHCKISKTFFFAVSSKLG